MKKFLLHILQFGLLLTIAYPLLLLLWGAVFPQFLKPNLLFVQGGTGHMHTRMEEVKHTGEVDILFLGSSHAYRGFDTRLFEAEGYRVFNLGSSSQSPLQTQVLLNRYLNQLHPKHVIYEVYPGAMELDGVESAVDVISNDTLDTYAWNMLWDIPHIKVANTFLYVWLLDLWGGRKTYQEAPYKPEEKDTYISGGYVQKKAIPYPYPYLPKRNWGVHTDQLRAFEAILSDLEARGISVTLVYAPITSTAYQSYLNQEVYDKIFHQLGDFQNFNEKLPLVDSLHFYDAHHLNQEGVEIFNRALLDSLKKSALYPRSCLEQ
ncbi:MAG: hypothetical protein AAFW00_14910 [Bacteroidota bacterium]